MSGFQALVLALVQGLTELFPISSLGHAVILPKVLGWQVDEGSETFLPFLVVLHLGTALALLLYFWRDWMELLGSVVGIGTQSPSQRAEHRRLLFLLIAATIPAGLIGLALEGPLSRLFGTPSIAALFLIVNGGILFVGERQRRKADKRDPAFLSWKQAIFIGTCQAAALIPGISRSGVTMVAGLVAGLSHEDSARFSFLLATPIIAAAGLLEVPKLIDNHNGADPTVIVAAGVVAGVAAFLSVATLMRYFKRREILALDPFAYYCTAAGIISLVIVTVVR